MTRKTKARNLAANNVVELTQALILNGQAIQEGPKRKTWSKHDLKYVTPLTPSQHDMFDSFENGQNILAHGSAGTGKSFVALYLALRELVSFESPYDRIVIVRSAVPARDVGFLPGTLEEKNAVYEQPYRDILHDLFGRKSTYDDMKAAGKIDFVTTSFIRGMTWDNVLVIFDEAQNANWEEINTVMTRMGTNSRIIVCGDIKQNDLLYKKADKTGIDSLITVSAHMDSFDHIEFTRDDIVRSDFVKQFIVACEQYL